MDVRRLGLLPHVERKPFGAFLLLVRLTLNYNESSEDTTLAGMCMKHGAEWKQLLWLPVLPLIALVAAAACRTLLGSCSPWKPPSSPGACEAEPDPVCLYFFFQNRNLLSQRVFLYCILLYCSFPTWKLVVFQKFVFKLLVWNKEYIFPKKNVVYHIISD